MSAIPGTEVARERVLHASGETETMSAHEAVNILMVDDQPGKLLSYEVILSELGERLIKAASAREAGW